MTCEKIASIQVRNGLCIFPAQGLLMSLCRTKIVLWDWQSRPVGSSVTSLVLLPFFFQWMGRCAHSPLDSLFTVMHLGVILRTQVSKYMSESVGPYIYLLRNFWACSPSTLTRKVQSQMSMCITQSILGRSHAQDENGGSLVMK